MCLDGCIRTYSCSTRQSSVSEAFNLFLPIFQKQLEVFRSAEDNTLRRCHAIDSNGRTIWIADAHRDDGKRFVARAGEKLTAFLELESGQLIDEQ